MSKKGNILLAFLNISSAFVYFVFPSKLLLVLVLLQCAVVAKFYKSNDRNFCNSIFWPILLVSLLMLPWPISFIIPILIFFGVIFRLKIRGYEFELIELGELNKNTLLMILPTIVLSSLGLILWVILAKPDLSASKIILPSDSIVLLVISGLFFSVFNAIWEEIIFKGVLWNGAKRLGSSFLVLNLFQSILFGVMHLNGFPRGIVGAFLAGMYGLLIGFIRKSSNGLLAPVITHFFADATIFIIIALA